MTLHRVVENAEAAGIVVVASSAGGIAALHVFLGGLTVHFGAAVVVVQHRTGKHSGLLERVLQRHCALRVRSAEDGAPVLGGTVYVAPADAHLTISLDLRFQVTHGPRIHYVRSSADPLFVTAARAFGSRVVAIVLTGGDADASGGVRAVADAGGIVLVQDPSTALVASMPLAAQAAVADAEVLPPSEMARSVTRIATGWR